MTIGASVAPAEPSVPLLPDRLPATPRDASRASRLPDGCYLLDFNPADVPSGLIVGYDGTLRVESTTGRLIASGDLYQRLVDTNSDTLFGPPPDPAAGIPIFPLDSYRYYLRVIEIRETDAGFDLVFEALRYDRDQFELLNGATSYWAVEGMFTATMAAAAPPDGAPPDAPSFAGEVVNRPGHTVGELKMVRVSSHLRKATLEIDCVTGITPPRDNGAGLTWEKALAQVGWDLTVRIGDTDVKEPPGGSWKAAEAHDAMSERREKVDINKVWHFYALCVRMIDGLFRPAPLPDGTIPPAIPERGYMFDVGSSTMNELPREGLMVSADWPIPDKEEWGLVKNKRAGDTVVYFRTALHELGHAMGLWHNKLDNGFMNSTDVIAANSLKPPTTVFPANMQWSFAPDDQHRMRHWPDIIVRPGGTRLSMASTAPATAFKTDRLRLDVTPVAATVPLGAPVRVDLTLTNVSDKVVDAPASISLKSGFVRGRVIEGNGAVRTFSPLVVNENDATSKLPPGESVKASLTLFAGPEGVLFEVAGDCRIVVEVAWHGLSPDPDDSMDFVVSGEAKVQVTPAEDRAHAEAAQAVLKRPDILYVIAFGGDHLKDANEAIAKAMACKQLRPHFAYIEAKRLATRFKDRAPDLRGAAALIDRTTIMSVEETRKRAEFGQS